MLKSIASSKSVVLASTVAIFAVFTAWCTHDADTTPAIGINQSPASFENPTSFEPTPVEVVKRFCAASLQGPENVPSELVGEVPESYENYLQNLGKPGKDEARALESLRRINPSAGQNRIVDDKYWRNYLAVDLPSYIHKSNYVIDKLGEVNIVGDDASVRVLLKSRLSSIYPDELIFLLHRKESRWRIFVVNHVMFADGFPKRARDTW